MIQEKKKYYLDLEFHEHKKPVKFFGVTMKKVWTIDLISIGIVCEDGREYYAMNRDLNLKYAKKDKWLKENVLDKLPEKTPLYPPHGSPRIYQESMRWLPLQQIKEEIIHFVGGIPDWDESGDFIRYTNGEPEFYGYYSDYDWVAFCWIFGRMIDLPNGFPMYCVDLKQMLDDKLSKKYISLNESLGVNSSLDRELTISEKLRYIKTMDSYPKLSSKAEHNALYDAQFNRGLHEFIENL